MTVNSLVARGLLQRQDELVTATSAGREAITGVAAPASEPVVQPQTDAAPLACDQTPPSAGPPKLAGKLGALLAALQAPSGATLESLMVTTGWQAHSVRGALSGALKAKRGIAVVSEKIDGVRRYRVEVQA